jgi:hypothetical protein
MAPQACCITQSIHKFKDCNVARSTGLALLIAQNAALHISLVFKCLSGTTVCILGWVLLLFADHHCGL